MSTSNSITATGVSGKAYTFNQYPLTTTFNAVGGVYVILKQCAEGNIVLYVGQTGDLSTRFNDHHKEAHWLGQGANSIAVIGVGTEKERLAIEADLVKAYNPPCNG